MPKYTFKCQECGHVFEDLVRSCEAREEPQTCPECGKVSGKYDEALTFQGNRLFMRMDDNHFLEQKFARNPHWQGISNTSGERDRRGKSTPGARRENPWTDQTRWKGNKVPPT